MSPAYRVLAFQLAIGVLAALAFFGVSTAAGTSALLAAGCVLMPASYFAWLQARTLNAVRVLLHGVAKLVLTLTLVGMCIAAVGIEPLGFFATFAALQFGYLVGLANPRRDTAGDPKMEDNRTGSGS